MAHSSPRPHSAQRSPVTSSGCACGVRGRQGAACRVRQGEAGCGGGRGGGGWMDGWVRGGATRGGGGAMGNGRFGWGEGREWKPRGGACFPANAHPPTHPARRTPHRTHLLVLLQVHLVVALERVAHARHLVRRREVAHAGEHLRRAMPVAVGRWRWCRWWWCRGEGGQGGRAVAGAGAGAGAGSMQGCGGPPTIAA